MEIFLSILLAIPFFIWAMNNKGKNPDPIEIEEENNYPFGSKEIAEDIEEFIAKSKELEEEEDNVLKVELTNPKFDISKIKEYEGERLKKFEFRPRNFKEFISQEQAKEQGKTIIKKVARGMKGHLFLSARQGMGKTTFIQLLANELNAKLITRVGKMIDEPEEIINVINEINTSKEKNVIFFIDEIEGVDRKTIKLLNPIIEQFEVAGKRIKPFIFAAATIVKDILQKNNPDFLDRIGHHLFFTNYNEADITKILQQYKQQLYADDKISNEVLEIIGNSCKFCPRIGISLLDDFIVEQDINVVLKNRRIYKGGLTEVDIKVLKVLSKATRAMGCNALSQRVGISQNQYLLEFEPFLVAYGYVERTPSRVLGEVGKKFLEELK